MFGGVIGLGRRYSYLGGLDCGCRLFRIRAGAAQRRIDSLFPGVDFAFQTGESGGNLLLFSESGLQSSACVR
jgi:hypothetical protein